MATLTIKFIGIVTLVCMGPNTDPCKDPTSLNVYLPSAPNGSLVCKKDDPKAIRGHKAYIRVKEELAAKNVRNWNSIKCNDPAIPKCFLYPLDGDEILVDKVTDGPRLESFQDPDEVDIIRWQSRKANYPLARYPDDRSIAYMSVKAGKVTFEEEPNGMFTSKVTVEKLPSSTTIVAEGPSGTKWMKITTSAGFDVIHLPKALAKEQPGQHEHADGRDHFYLHYLLAEQPPEKDCCTPSITPECPYPTPGRKMSKTLLNDGEGGANVDCSNSVYP